MPETWVRSMGWEDPLETGTATHPSVLAWRTPRTVWPWACIESDTTGPFSLSHPWLSAWPNIPWFFLFVLSVIYSFILSFHFWVKQIFLLSNVHPSLLALWLSISHFSVVSSMHTWFIEVHFKLILCFLNSWWFLLWFFVMCPLLLFVLLVLDFISAFIGHAAKCLCCYCFKQLITLRLTLKCVPSCALCGFMYCRLPFLPWWKKTCLIMPCNVDLMEINFYNFVWLQKHLFLPPSIKRHCAGCGFLG